MVGELFLLFGKPYRWNDGALERIPDQVARCVEEIQREGVTVRCHYLAGHSGSHQATKPSAD